MPAETRAVIDVGTNSVKVLIGAVQGNSVTPLHEESCQTRLGQGFYDNHRLQPGPIRDTAEAVRKFVDLARSYDSASIKIIGTSAARDAVNRDELRTALEEASRLPLTIISGEQEADWAFQGVATQPGFAEKNLLVLDVGGGSSEFILGSRGRRSVGKSFPLGTVRLLERFELADRPTQEQKQRCEAEVHRILVEQVQPEIGPGLQKQNNLIFVGTGGTISILARIELKLPRYQRELMENLTLDSAQVRSLNDRLWSLPLRERQQIIGLPSNRADVILPGVIIYDQVMELFGISQLWISTRGLRFAALMI